MYVIIIIAIIACFSPFNIISNSIRIPTTRLCGRNSSSTPPHLLLSPAMMLIHTIVIQHVPLLQSGARLEQREELSGVHQLQAAVRAAQELGDHRFILYTTSDSHDSMIKGARVGWEQ